MRMKTVGENQERREERSLGASNPIVGTRLYLGAKYCKLVPDAKLRDAVIVKLINDDGNSV